MCDRTAAVIDLTSSCKQQKKGLLSPNLIVKEKEKNRPRRKIIILLAYVIKR